MCEAGVNIKAMQDILGHADAETTLQIYTDATKDLKKAEMINFEDYFKAQKMKQTGTDWAYDQLTTDLRPVIKTYTDL